MLLSSLSKEIFCGQVAPVRSFMARKPNTCRECNRFYAGVVEIVCINRQKTATAMSPQEKQGEKRKKERQKEKEKREREKKERKRNKKRRHYCETKPLRFCGEKLVDRINHGDGVGYFGSLMNNQCDFVGHNTHHCGRPCVTANHN